MNLDLLAFVTALNILSSFLFKELDECLSLNRILKTASADSGITLKKSIEWMQHTYGFYLDEPIRTGVLFYKAVSNMKPNYYVDYLEDSPWIHMPYEKYETLKPSDLV